MSTMVAASGAFSDAGLTALLSGLILVLPSRFSSPRSASCVRA